jgi:hypothetical protein
VKIASKLMLKNNFNFQNVNIENSFDSPQFRDPNNLSSPKAYSQFKVSSTPTANKTPKLQALSEHNDKLLKLRTLTKSQDSLAILQK